MLEFRNACLAYGSQHVLSNVSLVISPGQRYGLLGSSGSGKSSLLRMAAGVLSPTSGTCTNSYRYPALLFQEPRLLPWRRVRENIEIPLRASGLSKEEARHRSTEWIHKVGLEKAAEAWPGELSGGMAQRASLARAFALHPDLLLLDEPFSALDPALRASLSSLCVSYVQEHGAALICSSHHPHELVQMVRHCLLIRDVRLHRYDIDPHNPAATPARIAGQLHQRLTEQQYSSPSES